MSTLWIAPIPLNLSLTSYYTQNEMFSLRERVECGVIKTQKPRTLEHSFIINHLPAFSKEHCSTIQYITRLDTKVDNSPQKLSVNHLLTSYGRYAIIKIKSVGRLVEKFTEFRKELENDKMLENRMSPMGQGKAALPSEIETKFSPVVDINVEPFEPCDEISIASSAVTVDLSIGFWGGTKLDKKASEEVTDANGAKKGVARVNKSLMGDNPDLKAIGKFVANSRNSNYAMTMPWGDVGQRLLPTTVLPDHRRVMGEDGERAQEFWRMVDEFLNVYDWEVTKAQAALGNLFVQADYPSVDKLRRKFHWNCAYLGLPTSGDWRLDKQTEGREQLIKEGAEYFKRQFEGAMNSVWKQVYGYLKNMSERLDYPPFATKEEKKGFHETLVTNVLDMVELLRVSNITGDVQMETARAKLEDALFGVTAASLKEDDYLRAETKRTVDEVIATLPSLDF